MVIETLGQRSLNAIDVISRQIEPGYRHFLLALCMFYCLFPTDFNSQNLQKNSNN